MESKIGLGRGPGVGLVPPMSADKPTAPPPDAAEARLAAALRANLRRRKARPAERSDPPDVRPTPETD